MKIPNKSFCGLSLTSFFNESQNEFSEQCRYLVKIISVSVSFGIIRLTSLYRSYCGNLPAMFCQFDKFELY